jgi:hypothetical protein
MSSKEKAEELVDKFLEYTPAEEKYEYPYAIQCALIAVDEILKALTNYDMDINCDYWQKVKQEIEINGGDK